MRPVLWLLAALVGCSASTTGAASPDATSDGALVDSAAPTDTAKTDTSVGDVSSYDAPAMDDAISGACNKLVNDGRVVAAGRVAENMPAAVGGVIVDGVYERTAMRIYTGPGGATGPSAETDQTVAWFHGGTFQMVASYNGGPDERSSGTYATSGSALTLTRTCPATAVSPYDRYSAAGNVIMLYSTSLRRELVYMRR